MNFIFSGVPKITLVEQWHVSMHKKQRLILLYTLVYTLYAIEQ